MKSFSKNILALSVTSALSLSLSLFSYSHAATYKVIDKNPAANLGYTYGGKLNNQGNMTVSGSNFYNFPVQFEYLDDEDFTTIALFSVQATTSYAGLVVVEDFEALKAGNPTANDLAWAKLYLAEINKRNDYKYQIVADQAGMINLGEGSVSTEICVFDTNFDGTPCTGTLTRSTVNYINGFNNSGIVFGTATAPYLPMPEFTNSEGEVQTYWLREHGQRGFYSPDFGETIFPVPPIETAFGGGISSIFDVNDNGTAVGYSSYKLGSALEGLVNSEDGGCSDPEVLLDVPYDICVQGIHDLPITAYYIQAFEASLSDAGITETKLLGLLVNPHPDDTRAFTSQAVAINNEGTAVGYAHGWDAGIVEEPSIFQSVTGSYAVMFKDGKVLDFNQEHYFFGNTVFEFSSATDINDSGIAVGFAHQISPTVKKFFYVDTTVPESEMKLVMPKGFFPSSVSTAAAINADGVIVGKAEIETHNDGNGSNPRRTAGFMYDLNSDSPTMIDLNTLIECDSEYTIFQANDINDNGQISASALVQSPAFDALGKPVFDDSGEPVMIPVVRAILLDPISGGELSNCPVDKIERKGGSFGGYILLSLISLLGLRRKKGNR